MTLESSFVRVAVAMHSAYPSFKYITGVEVCTIYESLLSQTTNSNIFLRKNWFDEYFQIRYPYWQPQTYVLLNTGQKNLKILSETCPNSSGAWKIWRLLETTFELRKPGEACTFSLGEQQCNPMSRTVLYFFCSIPRQILSVYTYILCGNSFR